jgi:predicted negative regulator of RcsB-dependent stress response
MSESTQTQTLEQTLNKTDFGHTLYENRKILIALAIVILVGVVGWVAWKESKETAALNNAVEVFEFQAGPWSEAKAQKMAPQELAKSFASLQKSVQSAPVMVPIVLEMGKFLYDKNNFTEAEAILSLVDGTVKHHATATFVALQRAVVLEKLEKLDEAIASLEGISKREESLLPAKVSIELGRLYLKKGDKGKAQTQFENVVNTYPNDEQGRLAKLYLSQLAQ